MQAEPQIYIRGRNEAQEILLSRSRSAPIRNIFSMGDPDSRLPAGLYGVGRLVKRYHFKDECEPNTQDPEAPQKEHVENIIKFARIFLERGGDILVHCESGISRSTAVGLILFYLIEKDAQKASERLLAVRPGAWPNKRMILFADEILGSKLIGCCGIMERMRIASIERRIAESIPGE